MTFGQQMQSLRKEKGLSQEALAGMLYVTRQSVSQWENDKSMPSVDLLLKLSQIFDISVDRLLGKEEEHPPIAYAEILRDGRLIAKAAGFRFRSSVSLLLTIAASVVIVSLINVSIFPAIYQNLPYVLKLNQTFGNWLTVVFSLMISAVLLFMRFRFQSRAKASAKELAGKITFFGDSLLLYGNDGSAISYFYANLRKIYENDCFLYITLPNRQTVILDRSALGEGGETVLAMLSTHKKYRSKKLVVKNKRGLSAGKAMFLQTLNNVLFVSCITAPLCFILIQTILRTNGDLTPMIKWMIFLAPWLIALAVGAVGIGECVHKIRAKRLMIAGASALVYLGIFFVYMSCLFPIYNFNQRVLPPSEFLAVAEEHQLNVTEANREHLDDYLWECYKATNGDGSIEITFMHFTEDLRWTSVRSARGAYDSLVSREVAKTNNNNLTNQGDFYCNACFTTRSENGRYCYVSLNRYTIVAVSTTTEHIEEVAEIFADYRLSMPL